MRTDASLISIELWASMLRALRRPTRMATESWTWRNCERGSPDCSTRRQQWSNWFRLPTRMVTCKQPPKSLRMLVRSGNDQLSCVFLCHKKGNECTLVNLLSLYMHAIMQNRSEHGSKVTDNQDTIQCMQVCITTVAWTSFEELANSDAQYHLIEWAEHNELWPHSQTHWAFESSFCRNGHHQRSLIQMLDTALVLLEAIVTSHGSVHVL